jgi:hypothetical protein
MMATTHVLAGIALASVALYTTPELAPVAVAAAALGGLVPDLDLYAGHRKTLHFPVYLPLVAVLAVGVAALAPGPMTVAAGYFLLAAAVHSIMDAYGGGLELRPWLGTSNRAVYDHFNGRWISPRRGVRYDGAPEDLALAGVLALPGLLLFEPPVPLVVGAILAVSAVYTLLRRRLVGLAEWFVDRLPETVIARVPERFVEDIVR